MVKTLLNRTECMVHIKKYFQLYQDKKKIQRFYSINDNNYFMQLFHFFQSFFIGPHQQH